MQIVAEEEKGINNDLFRDYFKYQNPNRMYKNLNITKNTKRNEIKKDLFKGALTDFKDRIKQTSEDEINIEKPYKIVDIVEKILEFNRQNQEGQGLKILTTDQMLSRLTII